MRHVPAVLAAAGAAAAIAAAQALLVREQLAEVASNARPRLDPFGTATGALALLLTLAVYGWLGWAVARRGGTTSAALVAGIAAGVIGGALGGLAQTHGVEEYLGRALGRLYVPAWFLPAALGLYGFLLTLFGALAGGAAAWLGARAARRGRGPTRS